MLPRRNALLKNISALCRAAEVSRHYPASSPSSWWGRSIRTRGRQILEEMADPREVGQTSGNCETLKKETRKNSRHMFAHSTRVWQCGQMPTGVTKQIPSAKDTLCIICHQLCCDLLGWLKRGQCRDTFQSDLKGTTPKKNKTPVQFSVLISDQVGSSGYRYDFERVPGRVAEVYKSNISITQIFF